MNKKNKIYLGSITVGFALIFGLLISSTFNSTHFANPQAVPNTYTLTLDSKNAYQSGDSKQIRTDSGNYNVGFTYSLCAQSSEGHAKISSGGSIKNSDHILSIKSFCAVFTGNLQLRTSFDGTIWSEYFSITSNETLSLEESKPYYIEMKADGVQVDLKSAKFTYYCQANDIQTGGYKKISSLSELTAGKEVIIFGLSSNGEDGIVLNETIYNNYYLTGHKGTVTNDYLDNANNSSYTKYIVSRDSNYYIFKSTSNKYLSSNVSDTHYNLNTSSTLENGAKWTISLRQYGGYDVQSRNGTYLISTMYNGTTPEFKGNSSNSTSYPIYFFIKVNAAPSDKVGFSISDSGSYRVGNTYNNSKLTVTVNYSNGTNEEVDDYTWVLKNPSGQEIPHGEPFTVTGKHTLIVTYGNFSPKSLILNVFEKSQAWEPVTDVDDLNAGDVIAIGESSKGYTAGNIANQVLSAVSTTFTNGTIEELPDDTIQLTLGKNGNKWTLANSNKALLGATAAKKLAWDNGTTDWSISIDKGKAAIQNDKSTYGKILFNANSGQERFTSYTSDLSNTMLLPQIYKGASATLVYATDIILDPTSATINVGENKQVSVTFDPSNTNKKDITWLSSDPTIASVSNGLVTGLKQGTTSISATYVKEDSTKIIKTCSITVKNVAVESVSLNKKSTTLEVDKTEQLTATVLPNNATDKTVTWESLDTTIATVSSNGLITAKATGSTTIKAKTNDGAKTDSCTVTVTPKVIYVTSVSLSQTSKTININEQFTLTATVSPNNATDKSVSWSTSNSSIATVSNGTVKGVGGGKCTITATTNDGSKKATCDVTVNVPTTGVTLSQTTGSVEVGSTLTLIASVLPSTATNKNVTWTSSNTGIATVSNGVVTGVAEGQATIKVTTDNGGYSDQCEVTVLKIAPVTKYTLESSDAPSSYGADKEVTIDKITYVFNDVGNSYVSGYMQCKRSSSYIYNKTAISGLKSIKINTGEKSWSGTVYYGTSAKPLNLSVSETGGKYTIPSGNSFFCLKTGGSGVGYIKSIEIEFSNEPIYPTSISIPSSTSISKGETSDIEVTYSPTGCNDNKGVTWKSSDTGVVTVTSTGEGKAQIKGVNTGTATITVTSTYNSNLKAICNITVTEQQLDEWTILMYICGADLESDYAASNDGCATSDLEEIASVEGQPSDVNYVIQAGGANTWSSKYSSVINKDKANRFHLSNKTFEKDEQINKVNMGLQSSLENFITWGLNEYPAKKVGLILWDHGGAMEGCCYDEQFGDDVLKPAEAAAAIKSAKSKTGYTSDFEFIGYDCCLMQVQDIASLNSQYAKYQIASEESEWGYGWSYDRWLVDLFAKKSTPTILKSCIDGYAYDTQVSYEYWREPNDQTLSYLDLSKWSAYQTAWENMATRLTSVVNSSQKWTTFTNLVNTTQKYGYYQNSSYNNGYRYDIFDVGDFFNKMKASSTYKSDSELMSDINECLSAYKDLVAYEWHGSAAGNSTGLTMFCPIGGYNSYDDGWEYSSASTLLTTWRSLCVKYGNWY